MDQEAAERFNYNTGSSITKIMKTINSEASLRAAIQQLEIKRASEVEILREEMFVVYDRMKPVNIITRTFNEITQSKELNGNVVNASLGLAAGFVSKIILGRLVKSPAKQFLGSMIMYGITNIAVRHPEVVRSLGKRIFGLLRGRNHADSGSVSRRFSQI
jgi:hypothetical protein